MRTKRHGENSGRHFMVEAQDSGLVLREECNGPRGRKLAGEFAKDFAQEIERRRLACPDAKWQMVRVSELIGDGFVQVFSAYPGTENWACLLK